MCNRYNLYAKCIGGIFEMEIYEITQFLIIEINKDDAVIMTDSNVVNLTNSFMIEFLKEIELYQIAIYQIILKKILMRLLNF